MTRSRNPSLAVLGEAPEDAPLDPVRALLHDLRQPVAAIRLLSGPGSSGARKRLDAIATQAAWLATLIDEVLVGASDDRAVEVELGPRVAAAVDRARAGTDVMVTIDATPGLLVRVPPIALDRALVNLLDNAVRAARHDARRRGVILVQVARKHGLAQIDIVDNGPGLGGLPSGRGLGLSITHALLSSCTAELALSDYPGGGALARITLSLHEYWR